MYLCADATAHSATTHVCEQRSVRISCWKKTGFDFPNHSTLTPSPTVPAKKKRTGFPNADIKPTAPPKSLHISNTDKRPIRWGLIALFLLVSIGGTYLAIWLRPKNDAPRYTYKLIKTYPHDKTAFTQGLVMQDGFLWESTGLEGASSIRKTKLETGEVLLRHDLDKKYFGEGLAFHDDQFYQLTWKDETAFVYNKNLEPTKEIKYDGDGWGLTSNGTDLILSDGSSEIRFLDPETFKVRRSIRVRRGGLRVGQLNELEFAFGKIYANSYQTDFIFEIDPEFGDVTAVIDLSGLWPHSQRPVAGVLNGIALNPKSKRLLVTGKECPSVFEIELILVE